MLLMARTGGAKVRTGTKADSLDRWNGVPCSGIRWRLVLAVPPATCPEKRVGPSECENDNDGGHRCGKKGRHSDFFARPRNGDSAGHCDGQNRR